MAKKDIKFKRLGDDSYVPTNLSKLPGVLDAIRIHPKDTYGVRTVSVRAEKGPSTGHYSTPLPINGVRVMMARTRQMWYEGAVTEDEFKEIISG